MVAPSLRCTHAIPGINKHTVMQQLANLKASGDCARIARDQEEIEEEEPRLSSMRITVLMIRHSVAMGTEAAAHSQG
jgi:hypothetical protein